jgi:hypothetical protein
MGRASAASMSRRGWWNVVRTPLRARRAASTRTDCLALPPYVLSQSALAGGHRVRITVQRTGTRITHQHRYRPQRRQVLAQDVETGEQRSGQQAFRVSATGSSAPTGWRVLFVESSIGHGSSSRADRARLGLSATGNELTEVAQWRADSRSGACALRAGQDDEARQ